MCNRHSAAIACLAFGLAALVPAASAVCTPFNGTSTLSGTSAYDCIIVNGTLTISGSVTCASSVIVNGTLNVTGKLNAGSITINGSGVVAMDGVASLGDVNVNGRLTVAGVVTASALDVHGSIDIEPDGVLTLTGAGDQTSSVTGFVNLEGEGATLAFTTWSHTFSGQGGIRGRDGGAVIDVGSGITLVNTGTIAGALTIQGAGTFVNQGAVDADTSGVLLLTVSTVGDSSGSGRWEATDAGATLRFSDPSGEDIDAFGWMAGEFLLTAGAVEFNSPLSTSGRLVMSGGLLKANANVAMGDDVTAYAEVTGGAIQVAAGATFTHD